MAITIDSLTVGYDCPFANVTYFGVCSMKQSLLPLGFSLLAGALMFGGLLLVNSNEADGRMQYNKAFGETYPDNKEAGALAGNAKCTICHSGANKKMRNDYGMALGKAIGAMNEKNDAKIKEALKKVEGEKSGTEGKTFGDLLKAGKLPGK
jgi:hypothetical protein